MNLISLFLLLNFSNPYFFTLLPDDYQMTLCDFSVYSFNMEIAQCCKRHRIGLPHPAERRHGKKGVGFENNRFLLLRENTAKISYYPKSILSTSYLLAQKTRSELFTERKPSSKRTKLLEQI